MSPRKRRHPTDPAVAVAYIRTSTDEQRNSLAAQRDAIAAYAKLHKMRVVGWHEDAGVSGGKAVAERDGFAAGLAAMAAARAGVLLIAKRDRLARDMYESAIAARLVERTGARIVSCDGVSSEDTAEGQLMRAMVDAFAQFERALIRARTKAALTSRRERGRRFSRYAPFGFAYENGQMVPVPKHQETLARMRVLRARGRSYRAIGEQLMKEGRLPQYAERWSIPVIRTQLLRPALALPPLPKRKKPRVRLDD